MAFDDHLSVTYSLVYAFLKTHSHDKAAKALKKSAKNVLVLDDSSIPETAPLEDIVRDWRQVQTVPANEPSSSSSSDSDSESDSAVAVQPSSKSAAKALNGKADGSQKKSTSSGSRSSDEEKCYLTPVKTKVLPKNDIKPGLKAKKSTKTHPATELSSKSSINEKSSTKIGNASASNEKISKQAKPSDNESSSDSSLADTKSEAAPTKFEQEKTAASASSSENANYISDTQQNMKQSKKQKTKVTTDHTNAVKPEEAKVTKKRRTSFSGTAVVTAVTTDTPVKETMEETSAPSLKRKESRKSNAPFQRVKANTISFADDKLKDNSFDAKPRPMNDYGERANRDLIVTRGDGFRKEKNKKKRGSYRGGEITLESHSIKFDY